MQKHFGLGNYLHKLRFIDEDIITNKKYVKKVHKAAFNGIQEINTIDPKEQEYNENQRKFDHMIKMCKAEKQSASPDYKITRIQDLVTT